MKMSYLVVLFPLLTACGDETKENKAKPVAQKEVKN